MVAIPLRNHQQLLPIGMPCCIIVPFGMVGDALQAGPIEIHDIDLVVLVTIARETDPLTVRRELGPHVHRRVVCQAAHSCAIGRHGVDFIIPILGRSKGDQAAVG